LIGWAPLVLVMLLAAGLLLGGCQTTAPRGSAASAMSSNDRSASGDSDVSATMRRLFSPLRQGPSGR